MQITRNYFYTILVSTAIMVLIPLIIGTFLSTRIWSGDELVYPVLHALNKGRVLSVYVYPVVIWFVTSYYFFKKIIRYLEEMLQATRSLIEQPNEKVVLRNGLSEFEQEINQIREDNLASKKVAQEADKRKNDLLVYLAHDLRTPLTSIIGYLAFLQDKQIYDKLDSKKRSEYIKIISDKAHRLEALINDFFEIAKIGVDNKEIAKEEINLSLMLAQVSSEFLPLLHEKNLKWTLAIEANIFTKLNVIKFERVLDNLIRNAISYAPKDTEIQLSLYKREEQVVLTIQNTSETLSTEAVNQLFEPFFRADQSRNTKTGNAGLGLAIAKQIITEHGGTIEAKSVNKSFEVTIKI